MLPKGAEAGVCPNIDPVLKPVEVVGVCPNPPKEDIVFGVLNMDADVFCGCCWLAKENPVLNVAEGWADFGKIDVALYAEKNPIHDRSNRSSFIFIPVDFAVQKTVFQTGVVAVAVKHISLTYMFYLHGP